MEGLYYLGLIHAIRLLLSLVNIGPPQLTLGIKDQPVNLQHVNIVQICKKYAYFHNTLVLASNTDSLHRKAMQKRSERIISAHPLI